MLWKHRVAHGFVRASLAVAGVGVVLVLAVLGLSLFALSRMDWDWDFGPGDGKQSARLAVDVTPRTGLADNGLVSVTSHAFSAGSVVGVAVCLREADTEQKGVDVCDKTVGSRFAVPSDGRLDATFVVARVITVGGVVHDCAKVPCLIVAADVTDFDRSGGKEIRFAAGLPSADLTRAGERGRSDLLPVTVDPAGPVSPGATLSVTATGLVPGEPVLVAMCTNDFLRVDPWEACRPDDVSAAVGAIFGANVGEINDRAGPDGSFTANVTVPRSIEPYSGSSGAASCPTTPGRCAVVIAAAADTKRSAYLSLTVVD